MQTNRIICIHCLMIVVLLAPFASVYAGEETLYFRADSPVSGPYYLDSAPNPETYPVAGLEILGVELPGKISRGTVASGAAITGAIRLAAYDTVSGTDGIFTLTLKKNNTPIGSAVVNVPETVGSPLFATYPVSFTTTESFTGSDDLIWEVAADSGNGSRSMQIAPDDSQLIFPLQFSWTMFLPAMITP